MKVLIPVLIGLLVVGCGKKESQGQQGMSSTAPEQKPKPPKVIPNSSEVEAAIEEEIRELLDKPTGELTKVDLEKVTMLNLYNKGLTDVKSLEKLTQLSFLALKANKLTDVKGLEKLT